MSCERTERLPLWALRALPPEEARDVEAHLETCADCRREARALDDVVGAFSAWPIDVLRPSGSLWPRLVERIAPEAGAAEPELRPHRPEPEWEDVAPGIACKLLATDAESDVVSMLVRLAPGAEYPPHTHARVEELHLLDGELWIDDRKLLPGDYNRAEPGTTDARVWSETGCTCFLSTSTRDVLR